MLGGCGDDGLEGEGAAQDPSSCTAVVPDPFVEVQEAVDALPSEGGTVCIRAGLHETVGVHVNRSNVGILGEPGALLRLADGANRPVLLLGPDDEVPTTSVSNVSIAGLEIDGNRGAQTSETDPLRPWIRNNGIDARSVEGLWIDQVDVHDARSGGLVVSWNSRDVFLSRSAFRSNFYDGFALYASEDIVVSEFVSSANDAAGLSLDNALSDVQFPDGRIEANGDVGIFARDSTDLTFSDLVIADNVSHGAFLSHQVPGNGSGVERLLFVGCRFLDNGGYGLWLASPSADSPGNAIVASQFAGNGAGAINLDPGAELQQVAVVFP